jgi:hypothetical protein
MITTLYSEQGGVVTFDIVASRNADITTAMDDVTKENHGPGGMRLLTANRAYRLLEKTQKAIDHLRQAGSAGILTGPQFVLTQSDLGTVTVLWADGE